MPHALKYPFPDSISPHAEQLEVLTKKWLHESYPGLPDTVKSRYEHTKTGYLTARFYPYAAIDRLIPLARSSMWGLAFDDYYEHSSPEVLDVLKHRLTGIIRGEVQPGANEYEQEMAVMAAEFRQFMSEEWTWRFANSMEQYIQGMMEEAPYKASMTFPSLDIYQEIRWRSVDVLQMINGLEVATGYELPEEVYQHPDMQQFIKLTCRIIAWANDYFSVEKETGRDVMNLSLILSHERAITKEASLKALVEVHNNDLATYLALCKHIPDFGSDNMVVKQFISANHYMIAGHWRWYLTDTLRYRVNQQQRLD